MNYRKENKRRLRLAYQSRKETSLAAVRAIRKEVAKVRRQLKQQMRRKGLRSFSTELHARQTRFEMPDSIWLPDGTRVPYTEDSLLQAAKAHLEFAKSLE